ncbi:MAG: FKBP-type peptidyl-prolyl cis-trans isomerase [Steroidobacteraceae bacterium]
MTLVLASLYAGAQTTSQPTPASADEALYTMGINLGQQLHQNGVTTGVSMDRIEQGIKDGIAGKNVTGADQMRLQAYLRAAAETAAARNAAAAHAYLERNAKAPSVMTTASGLQYKILQAGDLKAASPQPTDRVTLSFRGSLLDGTEFASSSKPGTAATVQVNGVMKAWTEALTLMKPGAEWRLFVPPELGFGQVSRLGIPGGSLLIYDLQLLSVAPSPVPGADALGHK